MFGMKKSEPNQSDLLIKKVSDLLFPPFETREVNGERYSIDSSVDTNVEAVLTDLRDGYMDDVCVNTLQAIFNRLYEVRKELKAFHEMDPRVEKYIIAIDTPADKTSNIEAAEDQS